MCSSDLCYLQPASFASACVALEEGGEGKALERGRGEGNEKRRRTGGREEAAEPIVMSRFSLSMEETTDAETCHLAD